MRILGKLNHFLRVLSSWYNYLQLAHCSLSLFLSLFLHHCSLSSQVEWGSLLIVLLLMWGIDQHRFSDNKILVQLTITAVQCNAVQNLSIPIHTPINNCLKNIISTNFKLIITSIYMQYILTVLNCSFQVLCSSVIQCITQHMYQQ